MHIPKLLKPGDTVAVTATSGPCDSSLLAAGVDVLKAMGLVPWVMESCHLRHEFFAGADDIRLRDLHMAFTSQHVKGIFIARGGYGAQRLLPKLDTDIVRHNPKVFVGYSDVTALHVVFNQVCGLITFHGPMVIDFGRGVAPFTMEAFKATVFQNHAYHHIGVSKANLCTGHTQWAHGHLNISTTANSSLTTIVPGYASGPLIGGNLCLLAASVGTPYEIDTRNCILFLEETGESPYRIDRMLLQLKYAGKLHDAAGILLGDFGPQSLADLHISINEIIAPLQKPTIAGLACGHTSPTLTLPLGHHAMLDATARNNVICQGRK